ncbi:MAG: RNA 2'-phosphotransferase [Deltaproteobacteria bacterium]|nr:MAG: RNA 2'-phosphotransferase [Deltaproteobacteria bacterium]
MSAQSKHLSWLLRHGAREAGLAMDEAGWARVDDVLALTGLDAQTLAEVVATNTKRRLMVRDGYIRACQGHSLDGMPVTREALEASWSRFEGPRAWHATRPTLVARIREEGLLPMGRTHVHLAPSPTSQVGKRSAPALLEIDLDRVREANLGVFAADNGVVLVRRVPPEAVISADR